VIIIPTQMMYLDGYIDRLFWTGRGVTQQVAPCSLMGGQPLEQEKQGAVSMMKIIAGGVASAVLKVAAYTVFGLILNATLLATRSGRAAEAFSADVPMMSRVGGALLIIGVCVCPMLFFILGKRQALQGLFAHILRSKKYDVIFFLIQRLHRSHPDIFTSSEGASPRAAQVLVFLSDIYRKLPWVIVLILQYVVNRVEFAIRFVAALDENRDVLADKPASEKLEMMASIISATISDDLMEPDLLAPLILLACNIGLFFI
jgi:hypothetical protein